MKKIEAKPFESQYYDRMIDKILSKTPILSKYYKHHENSMMFGNWPNLDIDIKRLVDEISKKKDEDPYKVALDIIRENENIANWLTWQQERFKSIGQLMDKFCDKCLSKAIDSVYSNDNMTSSDIDDLWDQYKEEHYKEIEEIKNQTFEDFCNDTDIVKDLSYIELSDFFIQKASWAEY